jgi:uncharacterized protein YcbX
MHLCRIRIFPIKSLDGIALEESDITSGGILEHDRIYAMIDRDGKVINGKRTPRVHQLRCAFDANIKEVQVWQDGGSPAQFHLGDLASISTWLTDCLGFPVALHRDSKKGFPDDRVAFGPTVVSEASLEFIQHWYPELSIESMRRRFRANLELGGGEPFCEDQLFVAQGELKQFRIGSVKFLGHNPCQRCVVPTRDPESGQALPNFQKTFMELRKQHLPAWADAQPFNHFYRFAVNTSIPPSEAGKQLIVGDPLHFA